jgi:hypothetical protein
MPVMRYQLKKNGITVANESSLARLNMLFEGQKESLRPGDLLEGWDTTKVRKVCSWRIATPEERAKQIEEARTYHLEHILRSATETVEGWLKKATEDMANPEARCTYQFRWADKAFEASAELEVAREVTAMRGAGRSWEDICGVLRREVMRGARSRPQSLSASSNLSETCKLSAMARMLENLEERV